MTKRKDMRKEFPYTCSLCEQPIPAKQWHDCRGIYDEERFVASGKLPRSSRRRMIAKYGPLSTSELYAIALKNTQNKGKEVYLDSIRPKIVQYDAYEFDL